MPKSQLKYKIKYNKTIKTKELKQKSFLRITESENKFENIVSNDDQCS